MIVSASRRTDIPCYYSEWLMNRLKAKYALFRNPMNRKQIIRAPLNKDETDCIVFWTKDAKNLLPHLDAIDKTCIPYYFQFTVTPYDDRLEKSLRNKKDIIETFQTLSRRIGAQKVLWRYDPIILNDFLTMQYHKEQFKRLCIKLGGYTESVTVSFIDLYAKLKTPLLRAVSDDEIAELAAYIGQTAKAHGLIPKACCETYDLSPFGIVKASCIDKNLIGSISTAKLPVRKDPNQRKGCLCAMSMDIGAYNTCLNGCVYCYANHSEKSIQKNLSAHDPMGEMLI
ncbi:MAG: DUF1848 domain-containing protein [Clostridiales bacterium]|jgi:hypothetical protein|nr:DUF1848 domain-containing protein [Clostridiales bacterium]